MGPVWGQLRGSPLTTSNQRPTTNDQPPFMPGCNVAPRVPVHCRNPFSLGIGLTRSCAAQTAATLPVQPFSFPSSAFQLISKEFPKDAAPRMRARSHLLVLALHNFTIGRGYFPNKRRPTANHQGGWLVASPGTRYLSPRPTQTIRQILIGLSHNCFLPFVDYHARAGSLWFAHILSLCVVDGHAF